MATQNIELSSVYTQIVNDSDEFFLSLGYSMFGGVEVATTDTDVVPTVSGHFIKGSLNQEMNRGIIGPGYVWARSKSVGPLSIVLSSWASS